MFKYIHDILEYPTTVLENESIGLSKGGLPIYGYIFGKGSLHISLVGGCHADEPVGPWLLRKLVNFLDDQTDTHFLLHHFKWTIIPHANPDGEKINEKWQDESAESANLTDYLQYAVRELPEDDIEFGFPSYPSLPPKRPENDIIYEFWRKVGFPYHLHVSLHGMAKSYGPWFLFDLSWMRKSTLLQRLCVDRCKDLGYDTLHDVNRKGEKGFVRINRGFCSRPDGKSMKKHFLDRDDLQTASYFHASSMECVRSFSGNTLTMVTEMPLFIIPKTVSALQWPNPELTQWSTQFDEWKVQLANDADPTVIETEAKKLGVIPMPYKDQMLLQWQTICAGVQQIKATGGGGSY
ncbi:MAG: M14 family zinc carboxypeptidase [Cyclobacteriaceae bacterium]